MLRDYRCVQFIPVDSTHGLTVVAICMNRVASDKRVWAYCMRICNGFKNNKRRGPGCTSTGQAVDASAVA